MLSHETVNSDIPLNSYIYYHKQIRDISNQKSCYLLELAALRYSGSAEELPLYMQRGQSSETHLSKPSIYLQKAITMIKINMTLHACM